MSKETFFSVCNWLIACIVLVICIMAFRDLFSTPPKTRYNPAKAPVQMNNPGVRTVPSPPAVQSGIGSLSPQASQQSYKPIQHLAIGHEKQPEAPLPKKQK